MRLCQPDKIHLCDGSEEEFNKYASFAFVVWGLLSYYILENDREKTFEQFAQETKVVGVVVGA